MPARESAEDKIARIVRETMAGERRAEEEKKDPGIGRLRSIVREELQGALGDLLNDEGDAKRKSGRRAAARSDEGDDDDGEGGGLLKSLGIV